MKKSNNTNEFDPKNPNAILDIERFDYYNLKGESFQEYMNMTDTLFPEVGITENTKRKFWFELHYAKPIFIEQYPGLPNSPKILDGIELIVNPKTNTSIKYKTLIKFHHARIHNNQIYNDHSRDGYGSFYLLSKETKSI